MRSFSNVRPRLIIIAIIISAGSLLAQPMDQPDPALAARDGRQVILVAPADVHGEKVTIRPLEGCTVHLVPQHLPDDELTHDCGTWFQPPKAGSYTVWLEQWSTISLSQSVISYGAEPFIGKGFMSVHEMQSAGWLAVSGEQPPEATTARFLSLEPLRRPFERRTPAPTTEPVRMPVGWAVAGWFTAAGDALMLSQPVLVRRGETAQSRPRKPTKGGDVLAVIQRQSKPACRAMLQLVRTNEVLTPDAFVESSRRLFAIWYGAAAGEARVNLTCAGHELSEASITVTEGTVTTARLVAVPLKTGKD